MESSIPSTKKECFETYLVQNESDKKALFCNLTWDNLHCWPRTPAGMTIEMSCASLFPHIREIKALPLNATAFRVCEESGQWSDAKTNYSLCHESLPGDEEQFVGDFVRYVTFTGGLVSLLLLTITFFIFTCFRSLENDRLKVHRNLVFSLIIRFLASLIFTGPFVVRDGQASYRDVEWICKILISVQMYSHMSSINWMFVEGLFLHSRLTSHVFDSRAPFVLYYFIGWGLPFIFTSTWDLYMTLYNLKFCWKEYASETSIWILVAPMIMVLTVNLIFLINILRIVVTKLQASQALETTQLKKAVRAALILFPLLGIPNLLIAFNPRDGGGLEKMYMICNALLLSSQGIFVAVLYCFCNSEVQDLIRRRWRRMYTRRGIPLPRRKSTKSTLFPQSAVPESPSNSADRQAYRNITASGRDVGEKNPDVQTSVV